MQVTKAELGEDVNYEELKIECEELINKDENDDLNDANGEVDADRIKKEQVVKVWKNDLEMEDTKVKLEEDVNYEEVKIESKELIIKVENDDLNDANVEIDVDRSKEGRIVQNWKNDLEMQVIKAELGEDVNYEEFKIESEELIIKDENDDLNDASGEIDVDRSLAIPCGQNQHLKTADKLTCTQCNTAYKRKLSLDDHIVRKHPHLIASVSSKIHECTHCSFKTVRKAHLVRHMSKHRERADRYNFYRCIHCNITFSSKQALDGHILNKHPDAMGSISTKTHECMHCAFKTVWKPHLARHMSKHRERAARYNFYRCIHCNITFSSKQALDGHILSKHPDAIGSISTKTHECMHCAFKTVWKAHLAHHMSKHRETADRYNFSTCVHCNAILKSKRALDDHTLRKHPDSMESISTKTHECMHCAFKTVRKADLARHMSKHRERADRFSFSTCIHCNVTFSSKQAFDGHILSNHPDAIGSISTKIHECTHCSFKTVIKPHLARHMSKHRERAARYNFYRCIHCNITFSSKQALDGHILSKHPDAIGSISTKTHECMHCAFKTVWKAHLAHHMSKHRETADRYNFSTCVHCNAILKSKRALDDHTLRKHPDSMESISTKIHECMHCAFKTVRKADLALHMSKHPETVDRYNFSTCIHSNVTFSSKQAFDGHILSNHPDAIGSISTKIHECTHCSFKTVRKAHLALHMSKHPETADTSKFSTCIHCNITFSSKQALDGHMLSKHPDSIGSISNKIHECTHCSFKTVKKGDLTRHMLNHPETADGYNFSTCIHCNITFSSKQALDGHILSKHPDAIGSLSYKIHECTNCSFITVRKADLARHMLYHPDTADRYNFNTCTHCNAAFRSKRSLDNHMLRKHPDSIGSISTKIHECRHCSFKTVSKAHLTRHMSKHRERADRYNFSMCIHCNITLSSKQALDGHILRKHPDAIGSISTKIYECAHCMYKTIAKCKFDRHMLKHP
ncbi:unnamed protein product [Callosobruchus maculatus]|uniref:C2H2-type domain-containing protein n=1 Tax=Callosobruchus maculatus TaxID=64391 RepID=A0A653CYA8_CALMS|nr:unnamed protein product [Callosobruchus maculatus]